MLWVEWFNFKFILACHCLRRKDTDLVTNYKLKPSRLQVRTNLSFYADNLRYFASGMGSWTTLPSTWGCREGCILGQVLPWEPLSPAWLLILLSVCSCTAVFLHPEHSAYIHASSRDYILLSLGLEAYPNSELVHSCSLAFSQKNHFPVSCSWVSRKISDVLLKIFLLSFCSNSSASTGTLIQQLPLLLSLPFLSFQLPSVFWKTSQTDSKTCQLNAHLQLLLSFFPWSGFSMSSLLQNPRCSLRLLH